MHPSAFEKKKIEILILWILPPLALLTSFIYWSTHNRLTYFSFLCVLPATFAAIAVTIAADVLKLWRWDTSIFPRLAPLQRPFVYAGYWNFVFMLSGHLLMMPTTLESVVESGLVIGVTGMIVGVLHDFFGVDVGLYKISGRHFDRDVHGTLKVVSRYGFYFFGALSFLFGIAVKLGYYFLYESVSSLNSWWLLGLMAGLLTSLPILLWSFSRFLSRSKK